MRENTHLKEMLIARIRKHTLLSTTLESELLDLIAVRRLSADRTLMLREEDHFFVAEGILKKESQPNQDVSHFLTEGQFGIFPPARSSYHFMSLEPTTVLILSQEDVDRLLVENRWLLGVYRKLLFEWAMERFHRMELLLLPAAEAKAALLARLGKLANRIPNKDLASYLSLNVSYYSTL